MEKKYVIKYADGCYFARTDDFDIVTDIDIASTYAQSTATQIARNEACGVVLYDEKGVSHVYKIAPKVILK